MSSFKSLTNPKFKNYDFAVLDDFIIKLINLLNVHVYTLFDRRQLVRIAMQDPKDGKVWWYGHELAENPEPQKPPRGPSAQAMKQKLRRQQKAAQRKSTRC